MGAHPALIYIGGAVGCRGRAGPAAPAGPAAATYSSALYSNGGNPDPTYEYAGVAIGQRAARRDAAIRRRGVGVCWGGGHSWRARAVLPPPAAAALPHH